MCSGKIKWKNFKKITGKNGFGYDPIFIPSSRKITFGQMQKKKEDKNLIIDILHLQKFKKKN